MMACEETWTVSFSLRVDAFVKQVGHRFEESFKCQCCFICMASHGNTVSFHFSIACNTNDVDP